MYITLTLLRNVGYETSGYENVRVRNVWNQPWSHETPIVIIRLVKKD